MIKYEKEGINLFVTIRNGEIEVCHVPCKVFLTKRNCDPIQLLFKPKYDEIEKINYLILPKYSVSGNIESQEGIIGKIEANEVWSEKGISRSTEPIELQDFNFVGNPVDLRVIEYLKKKETSIDKKTSIIFWLTPSVLLEPGKCILRSYNGEVKVDTVHQSNIALSNNIHLTMDKHYRYIECENNDYKVFSELIAESKIDIDA